MIFILKVITKNKKIYFLKLNSFGISLIFFFFVHEETKDNDSSTHDN